jgi:hypothetical protein
LLGGPRIKAFLTKIKKYQLATRSKEKSKMSKLTTCAVVLVLFTLMPLTFAAAAKSDCDKVHGTGHTFAIGPATFQGTASLNLNGSDLVVSVTTNLLGPPTATEDGTLMATTSHTFVFPDGSSFTTLDHAVLSQTDTPGLYNLNTRAAITGGSGTYELACGRLSIHGTIDLINGEVQWKVTGSICACG